MPYRPLSVSFSVTLQFTQLSKLPSFHPFHPFHRRARGAPGWVLAGAAGQRFCAEWLQSNGAQYMRACIASEAAIASDSLVTSKCQACQE